MRTEAHILVSALVAAAAMRRPGLSTALLIASSSAVDADHYLWYALRFRRWNPVEAYGFCSVIQADRELSEALNRTENRRPLHSPMLLLAAAILSLRWRRLRPVATGLGLHLLMDCGKDAWGCFRTGHHPHHSPSGSTVYVQ